MRKAGIVACSNGQMANTKLDIEKLVDVLKSMEIQTELSSCIYVKNGPFAGTGAERASQLMKFFANDKITEIYDISGGDMANEVLEYLDFDVIQKSVAKFFGYSDLTTIINAIYARTGKSSVLYQVKNLVWNCADLQQPRFLNPKELFQLNYEFVQGNKLEGVVVGGNIRCFLKLAGTKYYPDLNGKILLLEAMGGEVPQMVTYLSQLKQLGAFKQIQGILLGTFIAMEDHDCKPDMITLVKQAVGEHIPIVVTKEIGHRQDSKAIEIGAYYSFAK